MACVPSRTHKMAAYYRSVCFGHNKIRVVVSYQQTLIFYTDATPATLGVASPFGYFSATLMQSNIINNAIEVQQAKGAAVFRFLKC